MPCLGVPAATYQYGAAVLEHLGRLEEAEVGRRHRLWQAIIPCTGLLLLGLYGALRAQASDAERVCDWADVRYGRCKQGDIVVVTGPSTAGGPIGLPDSLQVATAVAQWCDFTKPVIRVSDSVLICSYVGKERARRTE